jgi:hypothetical protein
MQACGKKRRVVTGRGERNFGLAAAIDKRPVAAVAARVLVLVLVSALLCTAATHATRAQLSVDAQRLLSGCSVDAAQGKEPPAAV